MAESLPSESDDGGSYQRHLPEPSWSSIPAEYLNRTVSDSKDFLIRSAPYVKDSISSSFWKSQALLPEIKSNYHVYEGAFFKTVKDGLLITREHPAIATGATLTAVILLMRGPRRFLLRKTFGRFQSEEAQLAKVEKGLTKLDQAVQLTKNESKKLLERAGYAENTMLGAQTRLRDSAKQIQRLSNDLYKAESKVTDFMDELRELPGRDALKLRAEVASMMAEMKQQRNQLNKRVTRISDLGISA